MSSKAERFIPIHDLAGFKGPERVKLTPRQARLVYLHRQTVELAGKVTKAAEVPDPSPARIQFLEALDTAREEKALRALTATLKYYHDHGQLREAHSHLTDFAEKHWESIGNKTWHQVLMEVAKRHEIPTSEILDGMQVAAAEKRIRARKPERRAFEPN